jgi:uncharacterized membrane protein required for colicin V production
MSSLLTILMLVIIFACMATLYSEGMWSNAVSLINVVTAALLATNFFEPLAGWLDGWKHSYTYVWDFLSLWTLFAVFYLIFRVLTDQISRVKVRFLSIADQIGGPVFALLIGWAMVCFTMTTLHTAPLAEHFLFGGFDYQQRMVLGLAPDRQWLNFVQNSSQGAFCWSEVKAFDAQNKFMEKYAARRAALEANNTKTGSITVGP